MNATSGRPAVFLDRDGTLIEDRGHLRDPSQVVFFPETVPALARLAGQLELFIVTHQSGIADGILTADEVSAVNAHVTRHLRLHGIVVREVYVCPHRRSDACACIKPKTYFMELARAAYGIDLSRSFVIGDHPADVELAKNAGARGVYLLTGHGAKHLEELEQRMSSCVERCEIVAGISEAVDSVAASCAANVLRRGGLVGFPTETVYGLGACADDVSAIERIYRVKGRPRAHPLILHVGDTALLDEVGIEIPPSARALAGAFWPGPLTLILRRSARVLDSVTGGQETVGVRVPAHPLALAMLRELGAGVAAPSANRFGSVSPTTAEHVRGDLGGDVDFILDGGPCAIGVESTIVDLTSEEPAILRPGGVTREAIAEVLGRGVSVRGSVEGGSVRAPGMLASHYAPRARVVISSREEIIARAEKLRSAGARIGVAADIDPELLPPGVECLTPPASFEEWARSLYVILRTADARRLDVLLVCLPNEEGLGLAIADRLRRASR